MKTGKREILENIKLTGSLQDSAGSNGSTAQEIKETRDDVIQLTDGSQSFQNLILNGNFEYWYAGTTSAPDAWTLSGAGASIVRESTIKKLGTYSSKVTRSGADTELQQSIYLEKGLDYWKGRTVTLSCWVYATVASRVRIGMTDGLTVTKSSYHTGGSSWELLTVTKTLSASATDLEIRLFVDTGDTSGYFDGVMCVQGSHLVAYDVHPEDHLYKQCQMGIGSNWVISNSDDDNNNGVWQGGFSYTKNLNQTMFFHVPVPSLINDHVVVIDSVIIYYNTVNNGAYITLVRISQSDDDSSDTIIISHTDDLGNGSSGASNHDIVDTPTELDDTKSGAYLMIVSAGAIASTNVQFYSAKIKYHAKVH